MFIDQEDPPTLSKDQEVVNNQIFKFYKNLFSHKPCNNSYPVLEDFMQVIDITKITPEENTHLEQPFSKQEVASFIKSMSNNKAPGFTGIPPAFYKTFWPQIGELVTKAINNCWKTTHSHQNKKIGL